MKGKEMKWNEVNGYECEWNENKREKEMEWNEMK